MDLPRLPPSSSALIALASLTPPSPILSPSQLPTSLTSGDIPILLLESSLQVTHPSPPTHDYYDPEYAVGLGIFPSSSISTIGTVGTFGPTRNNAKDGNSVPKSSMRRDSAMSFGDSDIGYSYEQPNTKSESSLIAISTHAVELKKDTLAMNVEASSRKLATRYNSILRTYSDSDDVPTSPTVVRGQNSGHSSTSQSSFDLHGLSESISHQVQSSGSCLSSPHQKHFKLINRTNKETYVDMYSQNITTAAALATSEIARCDLAPSSPPRMVDLSKDERDGGHRCAIQSPKSNFPKDLAWLYGTTVEISIDQEGFRAVEARFRFTGYQRASDQSHDDRSDGTAQFRPLFRQAFNFHYAPFDSLPVLRRITVNGDESRDYISRQASLGLKSNGVYTVRGTEISALPSSYVNKENPRTHQGSDTPRLTWKFDYLVDDRSFRAFRKNIIDGEKVLTPLSFSCSPLLLHPLQGKRIKLMHIVKKSVAMKLVAEKMEPPSIRPLNRPLSLDDQLHASPGMQSVIIQSLTKQHVWSMHRRTKSQAPQQDKEVIMEKEGRSDYEQDFLPMAVARSSDTGAASIRHRRASSAGEWGRPISSLDSTDPHGPLFICHPPKHIIPPSCLLRMLSEGTETETDTAPVDIQGFRPLTPSPRHRQERTRITVGK